MSYRLLIILALFITAITAQGADDDTTDNRFADKSTEYFTAIVGQSTSRSGVVYFADAEIPPDPNTPAIMATIDVGDLSGHTYSVSIDGDDSAMFSAMITSMSFTENKCSVLVTYKPTAVGSHRARLNLTCSTAGVPLTRITLSGEATPLPGDVDGDGKLGISDVSSLIDMLLGVQ